MINNLHCHDIAIFTWKGCPYCFVYTTWQWIMFGTSNKIPNKLSELSTVYIMKKKKKYVLSSSQVWSFLLVYLLDCLSLFLIVASSLLLFHRAVG